ncbi:MAG: PHB depolymerase family esterase [Alphaproteobacteria bacterium]|nr:PHB depolymerase family esterase [Alphaproteobacteria bacterium]
MTQLQDDMFDATRLIRAGRLRDATALLQRLLRGATVADQPPPPRPDRRPDRPTLTVVADRADVADAEPSPASAPRPPRAGFGPLLDRLGIRIPDVLRGRHGPARDIPTVDDIDGATTDGVFLARTYANAAGSRAYKLYVPSGYAGQALPLIVMLHGCTQSPDDFAAGTRMNALAEQHGCLVAYPAQPASANASKCWNWFNPGDQHHGRGEPSIIAGITRAVMREYAVDPRRVFVAGLSAGGAAAAIMGMTYPDLYAAVGVHSGLACGAAKDVGSAFVAMQQGARTPRPVAAGGRPIPTIVFHGDADSTVNPRNGDDVLRQVMALRGGDLRPATESGVVPGGHRYSRTRYVDPAGIVMLEQWTVHGAGHAWSGGSAAGSYTDPRGPDAARAMMQFFLSHASAAP